jgi:hypothetical protein
VAEHGDQHHGDAKKMRQSRRPCDGLKSLFIAKAGMPVAPCRQLGMMVIAAAAPLDK